MVIRGARILVVSGIALFGLRGVFSLLSQTEMALLLLFLAGAAAIFVNAFQAEKRCLIGELACGQGLLTEKHVAHILSLQSISRQKFGEIAIREQYLSSRQLAALLDLQSG